MSGDEITFSFGDNWARFVETALSAERVEEAQKHLLDFLGRSRLDGLSFLDIGSGSGLHSLAAIRAGAESVVSLDVDPSSVRTTLRVKETMTDGCPWEVLEGSILDEDFVSTLRPADIVYAWGSLHHTGAMWEAIERTAPLVKPDGCLYLGLYTTFAKSQWWLQKKQRYNRSSELGKRYMEACYVARFTVLPALLRLESPMREVRQYKQKRGMDYMTDVRDWLGGLPFEFASVGEVVRFARDRLGMAAINVETDGRFSEFLFERRAATASTALAPGSRPVAP